MKRGFLERMERYALVGEPGWLRTTLNTLAPLFKAEIRHFGEDEEGGGLGLDRGAPRLRADPGRLISRTERPPRRGCAQHRRCSGWVNSQVKR